ncbi:hypothetical protein JCM21900_003529 [Sporobolomyces salmonicolor]
MPPGRSRSSTVSSSTSRTAAREHLATNPDELVASSAPGTPAVNVVQAFDWDPRHDSTQTGPRSYKSEHSMRTLRPGRGHDDDDDDDDDEGEGEGGSQDQPGARRGPAAQRRNPQFVIDLAPEPTTTASTRPRSSTFGGVPLPPAPPPHKPDVILQLDHSADPASDADSSRHRPSNSLLPHPTLASDLPANRGRSTSVSSVSSVSSLRSLEPALHLGGAPLRDRRPVLYAGLQAGALLLVSVLALYVLLKGLLPPIDEEHRDKLKLPKSFEDLKALNEVLQVYKDRNYWRVLGCYMTVYLFLQAFSIPGSMYLSILGGALYGVLVALPLVCFCVASGALLCYLLSAALGPAVLLRSEVWQKRVEAWTERVQSHRENLISYLIVLRIAPLPPHWVVNVVAPHLGISIWTFWISTFLGIAGVSYIHTQIGTTLDQMTSSSDFHLISWQNGVGLGGIILAVLIPVGLRRAYRSDLDDAAADVAADPSAPRSSFDPLLAPRTSLSLDGDARTQHFSTPREHLDGTPGAMTDGSARLRTYSDEEGVQAVAGRSWGPTLKEGGGSADKVSKLLGIQVSR